MLKTSKLMNSGNPNYFTAGENRKIHIILNQEFTISA